MKKLLGIVVLGFILTSCASPDYNADTKIDKYFLNKSLAKVNSSRLILLEPGMSKSQVFETMGTINTKSINNPWGVSLFRSGSNNITVIYYYCYRQENYSEGRVFWRNLAPIILLDGKLVGWGNEALRRAIDQYDLEINID